MYEQKTDRQRYLDKAARAAGRAANLAGHAESAAHGTGKNDQVSALTAAGALWTDVARTYTELAQAAPEPADDEELETESETEAADV